MQKLLQAAAPFCLVNVLNKMLGRNSPGLYDWEIIRGFLTDQNICRLHIQLRDDVTERKQHNQENHPGWGVLSVMPSLSCCGYDCAKMY